MDKLLIALDQLKETKFDNTLNHESRFHNKKILNMFIEDHNQQ